MKKLLAAMVFLAPGLLFAQRAFDGTWRTNLASTEYVGNEKFSIQDGIYRCESCVPKIEVKVDGNDHKVSGSAYFDTINVRKVDDHTVEMVNKKDGKVSGTTKLTSSRDGRTLNVEFISVAAGGQNVNGKYTSERVSASPAGAHSISGVWQPGKLENASETMTVVSYKVTEDGLSMNDLTGDSYTAKFDGNDYPYKGDPGTTSVSLKKIDENTIEETDKRDGKAIGVTRMTVSPDGKTMTVNFDDKLGGRSLDRLIV